MKFNDFIGSGVVFFWIANAKHEAATRYMEHQGFKLVEHIVWVKVSSRNSKLRMGPGFYLLHSHEICLVFVKIDRGM